MALSKKDLLIHITLNELYHTHSLILQHIETLVSNRSPRSLDPPLIPFPQARDKQHLRILTDELGPAPAQVSRKENRMLELQLYGRETTIQDI